MALPQNPLKLGFLTHVAGTNSPAQLLRDTVRLAMAAEELGYDTLWVAQHHVGAENGQLPSPFVLLAAIAEHTERIRLGTAVVILPLEDPVRAAEDAAVADLLSGGRLELGLGSGAHAGSYTALGRDPDERSSLFTQSSATLSSALSGEALPGGQRLSPHAPGLHRRIWRATHSEEGALHAAAAGQGLLLARSALRLTQPVAELQAPVARAYRDAAASPRLAVTRTVYPAPDHTAALRDLGPGTRAWSRETHPETDWDTIDGEELLTLHTIHTGPADHIARSLAADPVVQLADELIAQVQPGELGFDATLSALHTIAHDVAPALRRLLPVPVTSHLSYR
ncbi:LLM class flavin-dependent oxidoreductase [Streptomyces chartreusis]|uniref:LLM class flavin-dependent oxidoreductase n=1 Tax=Streptomyces chartreusis TaxID=1969 RepID=UPI00367A6B31